MMNLTMEHEHRVLGWRSGESTRLPPLWPGFDSLTCRHKWVELLLVLVPAPRVFLLVLRSTSLHKNQHSKFQFDLRFHHVMIKCALQISSIYVVVTKDMLTLVYFFMSYRKTRLYKHP